MEKVCRDCETVGEPGRVTKGSFFIEVVLWLCFIIPGLLYSLWRVSTRYDVCPACQSTNIVPLDSPVGRKLAGERPASATYQGSPRAEQFGRSIGKLFAKKKTPAP